MGAPARSAISARRPRDHPAAIAAMAHDGGFLLSSSQQLLLDPDDLAVPASHRRQRMMHGTTEPYRKESDLPSVRRSPGRTVAIFDG
jgi:hypothetical protein